MDRTNAWGTLSSQAEEEEEKRVEERLATLTCSNEDGASNFSFEIEALNNIEMPKNYEGPMREIQMVELPDRATAVYREVHEDDGRIVFRRTTNTLVIA